MKKPIKKNKNKVSVISLDERVEPIIKAIKDAAELFDKESDAILSDGTLEIENFYQQKKDMDKNIKIVTLKAMDSGLSLELGTPEAKAIQESLTVLKVAADRNAESLQGVQNALEHVNYLIKKSASTNGSEGMYNRHAKKVDTREKTIIGFGMSI